MIVRVLSIGLILAGFTLLISVLPLVEPPLLTDGQKWNLTIAILIIVGGIAANIIGGDD